MIEQGRKIRPKLSQSERICQLFNEELNGAVEDEIHFLFDCAWRKYQLHREKFIEDVGKMVTYFNYLNTSQKFLYIVTYEDKEILIKFAIFVTLMNKERERDLNF